jgi:KUP system potassium uptake protein
VKHNKSLHSKNAVLTVLSEDVPYVQKNARIEIRNVGESFYRIIARYGFMDAPDINEILDRCAEKGVKFDSTDTTFFLGRETILPSDQRGMALWREHLFSLMSRNATRATAYYNIPPNQVVEMGMQIEI